MICSIKHKMDFSSFLPEFAGAAVGAFLGYYLGVKQERKMRQEEESEEKKQFIESLKREIDFNSNEIKTGKIGEKRLIYQTVKKPTYLIQNQYKISQFVIFFLLLCQLS